MPNNSIVRVMQLVTIATPFVIVGAIVSMNPPVRVIPATIGLSVGDADDTDWEGNADCPYWSPENQRDHRHRIFRNNRTDLNNRGDPIVPNGPYYCCDHCNPHNCKIQFYHWWRKNRKILFGE